MEELQFKINGMHCTGCSNRLEKILNNIEGINVAKVDFESKIAYLKYNKDIVTKEEINEAIIDAGFEIEGE